MNVSFVTCVVAISRRSSVVRPHVDRAAPCSYFPHSFTDCLLPNKRSEYSSSPGSLAISPEPLNEKFLPAYPRQPIWRVQIRI
jgi:hypothetical protein